MSNLRNHLKHKTSHKAIVGSGIFYNRWHISRLLAIGLVFVFATVASYFIFFSHAASSLSADFNSDGVVNVTDLSILATNWGRTTATHAQGDANSDGTISIYDLSILASQWGQSITLPDRTILTDYYVPDGTHDVTYENIDFVGDNGTDAALTIRNAYNLTFINCTFQSSGWNGVTINSIDGSVHDVIFQNNTFKTSYRMNFETTERGLNAVYQRINLINNVFEPAGGEAISYDSNINLPANVTITGNTIKGAGVTNNSTVPWGQELEINGPANFTVTNNKFYMSRSDAFNLQRYTSEPTGWVINNNIVDWSVRYQSVMPASDAVSILMVNTYGVDFRNNTIKTSSPAGSVGWLSNDHDIDFSGTVFSDASNRNGYDQLQLENGCTNITL